MMSYSQTYANVFKYLPPAQIHDFAENMWTEQNISSDHPDITPFIERHHSQIVEECASDIEDFQKNTLPIWNSYQNTRFNSTEVFNLKLSSIGGTPRYIVRYNEQLRDHAHKTAKLNKNSKSQEHAIFLCQCVFKKWNSCDVLKIINDNTFKLECRYLNDDVKQEYAVVKITNAFHIFASACDTEKQQFLKHISDCEWIKASHFSIFLYQIQMKQTRKFVTNIMSQTEEMKSSQMNDCNNSNNRGVKREWNDTVNDKDFFDAFNELAAMNKIEEPLSKRRKLSHSNGVITDDDFHIKEETIGGVNVNEDVESKKQEISQLWGIPIPDIEEKLSNLSLIITDVSNIILLDYLQKCDLNIKSAINYHFSRSLSPLSNIISNNNCNNIKSASQTEAPDDIVLDDIQCEGTTKQENIKHESEPAFFNWEADIERDYNNTQDNNIQLQLTPIQSVILYKSAQKCQASLQLNPQYINRKQTIVQSIQEIGKESFEFREPNESQYNAICKSTLSPISLIHGPPGTGKTSTSAQLINAIIRNKLIRQNKKIFVCAYTHNAINELLKNTVNELLQKTINKLPEHAILRLGDKDKCPKKFRKFCLEQKMADYKPRNQDEKEAAWEHIFRHASVIVGTIYSSRSLELMWFMEKHNNQVFNWLLIDECTQIIDPVLTICVNILDQTSDSHLILIGDHKQLPPVIKSDKIKKNGFQTMFETLVEEIPINDRDKCGYYSMLNMQYRMPECLIRFSNVEWYDNKIQSHQKSVDFDDETLSYINDMVLNQINVLPNVTVYNNKNIPIYVIKIPNSKPKSVGSSWKNEIEGTFICQHILENLNSSITIGIVSFYKPQAKYIDHLMNTANMKYKCCDLMSQTVDAFQGKEKDLIILSTVTDVIGKKNRFNNDAKRINVALTRCKKALIVVVSFDVTKAHGTPDGKTDIWKRFFKQFDYGSNNYEHKMDIEPIVNNNINVNNSNEMRINMMNRNNVFRNNRIYGNNFNNFTVLNMNNNRIQVDPIIVNDDHQEVWDFLSGIDLTVYYDIFISSGFDRMSIVKDITIDDLQRIGINKWGHQKTITRAAKKEMGVSY